MVSFEVVQICFNRVTEANIWHRRQNFTVTTLSSKISGSELKTNVELNINNNIQFHTFVIFYTSDFTGKKHGSSNYF